MKTWRVIEYETPDDLAGEAWLTRTLLSSIDGTYVLPNGCRITACVVDTSMLRLATSYGTEPFDTMEELRTARKVEWAPVESMIEQRQRSRGDV